MINLLNFALNHYKISLIWQKSRITRSMNWALKSE
nr:MAG TPA: hypothetical protein [Caudoviricetes sp.]